MAPWLNVRMDMERDGGIRTVCQAIESTADERIRRRFAGAEAIRFGRGGVPAVVRVTGMSPNMVRAGIVELKSGDEPIVEGRQRRHGGGMVAAGSEESLSTRHSTPARKAPSGIRMVETTEGAPALNASRRDATKTSRRGPKRFHCS